MGEEVKVEHFIITPEDGQSVVFEGFKDIQFTESENDDIIVPREFLTDREATFTVEVKWPKFFRCKNRKRYKKLLMSLSKIDRNYIDGYLKIIDHMRTVNPKFVPSYQELWNEVRINTLGI